jgi:RNA polymerase sigma-70 factor (ECF subfamily)
VDLSSQIAEAAAAWPDIAIAPERFARFLTERCANEADLPALQVGDLYLACACGDGDAAAIAAFDRAFLSQLPRLLHRQRAEPAALDELKQIVATRLFVDGRIAQYSGRGPLLTWLKVVASRLLSNQRRSGDDRARIEDRAASQPEAIAFVDPELALIRQRFGVDFREALGAAFASLELRDRNLVRLHFVDRLGIDALAPIFQVSRATVARHLAAAREALTERTVANLGARLKLPADELASLVNQVRSKLDVSLSAVLR